jgi:hypothetical protein
MGNGEGNIMKIRMLTTAAGPEGSYQAGQSLEIGIDIPNRLAQVFVAGGFAEVVERDAPAVAPERPAQKPVETEAVQPVAEKAVAAAPVKKAGPVKQAGKAKK